MATTYEDVPGDVITIAEGVISEFHPELTEVGVQIGYLFARNPKGPAVKLHGYPCKAVAEINSYKNRKKGAADATITIDGDEWFGWSYEEQRAVLDHECFHFIIKRDKQGEIARDDLGRPKLKMRLHDMVVGGFSEIARRHGEHAAEVQHVRMLVDAHGQLFWEWGEPEPARSRGRKRGAGAGVGAGVDMAAHEGVAVAGAVG